MEWLPQNKGRNHKQEIIFCQNFYATKSIRFVQFEQRRKHQFKPVKKRSGVNEAGEKYISNIMAKSIYFDMAGGQCFQGF